MRVLLAFFAGDDFLAVVFRVLDELLFFAGVFFAVLLLLRGDDAFLAGVDFLAAVFLAVPEPRELLDEDDFLAVPEPLRELDAFWALDFFAVPELDAFLAEELAALLFLAGAFLAADFFVGAFLAADFLAGAFCADCFDAELRREDPDRLREDLRRGRSSASGSSSASSS